ncbi:MAG: hypothetical protein IIV43_05220, partial [Oscillospiraceae bacterium]|nr:hypothetical protein [Oscillospiraceae bacterium]
MSDTIAAIATGGVVAAIGILRVSGDDTMQIIDKVFKPISGKPMSSYPNRQLVYGSMVDADGTELDICLCTISRGPGSYTGEDTAELQTHGSPVVHFYSDCLQIFFLYLKYDDKQLFPRNAPHLLI